MNGSLDDPRWVERCVAELRLLWPALQLGEAEEIAWDVLRDGRGNFQPEEAAQIEVAEWLALSKSPP